MEMVNKTDQIKNVTLCKSTVHGVLAHSYLFYFISFLVAFYIEYKFSFFLIIKDFNILWIGVIFLILGTFLIFWAQTTSYNLKKENLNKETFCHGPYRFTRTPTHYGLFLLMFGFGISINALFIVIFSIISFLIIKFTFIKKEEKILASKYGIPYLEYKTKVKF